MTDYYFMSGDEAIKDAVTDGPKDYYFANNTYMRTGQLGATRAVGIHLIAAARFSTFLAAIGEMADAAVMSSVGQSIYERQVKAD